ncbi:SHOCT domain-containing protein [Verrucomicrobiota bacterium sgz303538]
MIHQDASGLKVFLYDTLDVRDNHCVLLIKPTQKNAEPGSVESRLRQIEGLRKSGLITEQEYQAKRREILEGL